MSGAARDPMSPPGLTELLARWVGADTAGRQAVQAEIDAAYRETLAIFVLDMSGFSSSVMRHGILAFLAKIYEMRREVVPIVLGHGGDIVKFIGDDVIAVFPSTADALSAARAIVARSQARPAGPEPGMGFRVAIGIGYGSVLHDPSSDVWGDEVNRAFKLGEDVAGPDEILLTQAAYASLTVPPPGAHALHLSIGGLALEAWKA